MLYEIIIKTRPILFARYTKVMIKFEGDLQDLNDRFMKALDGNAISLTDTNGITRIFDRTAIEQIKIEEAI